ncbi:unnamed protein product [Dibothriocephalus latus]|uniref:Uncharacterized protein n=1 Tax=Dibothriocephalus latus TaxID=60516 RepID=A0A3P7LC82_DIBLA|nr:unnamed protein product [Dibothriocephalus latus]
MHETTPNITTEEENASRDAEKTPVEVAAEKEAGSGLQSPSSLNGATSVTEDGEGQEKVADQDIDEVKKEASLGSVLKAFLVSTFNPKKGEKESESLTDDTSPHTAGGGEEVLGHVADERESKIGTDASSAEQKYVPTEHSLETGLEGSQPSSSEESKPAQETVFRKDSLSEKKDDQNEPDENSSKCPESAPGDTVSADPLVGREEQQGTEEPRGLPPTVTDDGKEDDVVSDTNRQLEDSEVAATTEEKAEDKTPVKTVSPKRHEQNVAENTRTVEEQETMVLDSFARVIVPEIRIEDYSQMPMEVIHPAPRTMASTPEVTEQGKDQKSAPLEDLTNPVQAACDETETF